MKKPNNNYIQLYSVFTSSILGPLRSAAEFFLTSTSECALQYAEVLGSM